MQGQQERLGGFAKVLHDILPRIQTGVTARVVVAFEDKIHLCTQRRGAPSAQEDLDRRIRHNAVGRTVQMPLPDFISLQASVSGAHLYSTTIHMGVIRQAKRPSFLP